MKVNVDGICEPNPGQMGIGIVFENGKRFGKKLGNGTNVKAECIAVLEALKILEKEKIRKNIIFTDCQLIERWISGEYELKSDTAQMFVPQIRKLLTITKTKIKWIPREQNEEADEESKKAMGYIIEKIESRSSKGKYYTIIINKKRTFKSCTCPDFQFRKNQNGYLCKHIKELLEEKQ